MASNELKDPYRNFRFRLEIDGIDQAGFREVTMPDSTQDVVEYREGNESPTPRKLSGLVKYGNVSLKWGMTDSLDVYKWRKSVQDTGAEGNRKNIAVILINEKGEDAGRWEFVRAWPTKYDTPDFNATGNEIAIESLEIAHEGMERTQ